MTEHEKLEYIHCTLQDVQSCLEYAKLKNLNNHIPFSWLDEDMIDQSLTMVEDIREKHFDENGKLIKLWPTLDINTQQKLLLTNKKNGTAENQKSFSSLKQLPKGRVGQ